MTLKLISQRSIDFPPDSHVFLSVVRNESLRLPYLLTYYRNLGFDQFVFVDNGSKDGTTEILTEQSDCHVFYTEEHFGAPPGAGLLWKNLILDQFCDGHWVLVADADEILVWPGSEREKIQTLTRTIDAYGAEVLFVVMLDMYSAKPFGEIGYRPKLPFIDYTPYFDRGPYVLLRAAPFPFLQIEGGVRARLYKAAGFGFPPPVMSKVPLLRWHAGQRFIVAQHALLKAAVLAPIQGALLHFKMFDDLPGKCDVEIRRGEYYAQGREYRALGTLIQNSTNKTFFDPAISMRYENTDQLRSMGLIGHLPSLNMKSPI